MGHKTIVKGVRQSFHESLLLRGDKAEFVPLSNLESWVEDFGADNKMSRIEDKSECSACQVCDKDATCFKYEASEEKEFPPHYHDKKEMFKVMDGSLTMEYLKDNRYQRTTLKPGDTLSLPAYTIHRGTIHGTLVANLSFIKSDE